MPHRFFRSEFRWNDWNREKIGKHGLSERDVEHAVRYCERGFPRRRGGEWLVHGRIRTGELIQVLFIEDPPPEETLFVFHAMMK